MTMETRLNVNTDTASLSQTAPHNRVAVRFSGVSKSFGDVEALSGVSLKIQVGETVALLGPNGAGKSTAIAIMLGLHLPSAGVAEVLGQVPQEAVASGQIGAMLQSGGLLHGVTVRELIGFVRKLYPRPMPEDELFQRADLASLSRRFVQTLSGGEAQRVRFAVAIAGNPDLIFLDEPTVAMDVDSRHAFWRTMHDFATSGRTVLFATHYLEEADAAADRIIVLSRGNVVANGSAAQIKSTVRTRTIRFTLQGATKMALASLSGITEFDINGERVEIQTDNADGILRALVASGLAWSDIEVFGAGIEEAFLNLTRGS